MTGQHEVSPGQASAPFELHPFRAAGPDGAFCGYKRPIGTLGGQQHCPYAQSDPVHLYSARPTEGNYVGGNQVRKDPPGSWPCEEEFPFGTK